MGRGVRVHQPLEGDQRVAFEAGIETLTVIYLIAISGYEIATDPLQCIGILISSLLCPERPGQVELAGLLMERPRCGPVKMHHRRLIAVANAVQGQARHVRQQAAGEPVTLSEGLGDPLRQGLKGLPVLRVQGVIGRPEGQQTAILMKDDVNAIKHEVSGKARGRRKQAG